MRAVVITGLIATGFVLCALVVAAYLGLAFGVLTALLGLLLALIPVAVVVPTFLWLDRFESEPARYLVVAFLWGALVSVIAAATLNTSAIVALDAVSGPDRAELLGAVVVAPFVEEAAKGLFVLIAWVFLRREFDGIIDGIVYAGVVAAGFAFTENIQYLSVAYLEGGAGALTATFVVRGLMSPFAHPLFTVMIGIGVGIAATTRSTALRWSAPVVGYVLAVATHSLWNLSASTSGEAMLAVYLLVEVPIFVGWIALVTWARRAEGRAIGTYLMPYADAGWFAPSELQMLTTMAGRRQARGWARLYAGPGGLAAMRAFQDAASELALLRRRIVLGHAHVSAAQEERELLASVVWNRRQFLGHRAA